MSAQGMGERFYRACHAVPEGQVAFRVRVDTTDLHLRAERDLSAETRIAVRDARTLLEDHIRAYPAFAAALQPLAPPASPLPVLLERMYAAAATTGVGPMAAVAGAVAEAVGRALRPHTGEILVENGGDVYLDLTAAAVVGVYAGASPFSGRIGLQIDPTRTPRAVCTSSGTVGPSLSYGRADAAVAVARDAALADAAATALGNRVRGPADLEAAVDWAASLPGVEGAVAILGDRLAVRGDLELVPTPSPPRLSEHWRSPWKPHATSC